VFFALMLHGGEWSVSHPDHFTSGKRALDTHFVGSWVGPRASLDMVVKRKNLCPCQESNPDCPVLILHKFIDCCLLFPYDLTVSDPKFT